MNLDSLEKLYVHELKDLFSAESQLLEALPKMAKAASNEALRDCIEAHLKQTAGHVDRLHQVFEGLAYSSGGHKCAAMEGLLKEGADLLASDADPEVLDAATIAAAQRVEHYEMAGYGAAAAFAERLGRFEDADLLLATLEEEGAADRKLSRVARRAVNFQAATA